ncbi:hypothetical protein KC343_g20011 [Hortaea werneckii]|nr:hypothetical protein KC343_g20011 [Hortaea werneckii]
MKTLRTHPVAGKRPLFIGSSITDVDGGLIVLGGGATCFSFGTYWTKPSILTDSPQASLKCGWHLLSTQKADMSLAPPIDEPKSRASEVPRGPTNGNRVVSNVEPNGNTPASDGLRLPDPSYIPRRSLAHGIDFERHVEEGKPVIFSDGDIGPCTELWNNQYLTETIGYHRKVIVHASRHEKMDFQNRNFDYVTQNFGDFLNNCARGEQLYLRSVSHDAPSDQPTNLADDYPEIAADFELPGELIHVVENLHSSPLRISGPVTMWLHYDVMANILIQVRGQKRLILYPPSDVSHLNFPPGASSSSLDIFHPSDFHTRNALVHTHPYEAVLNPGDILFIPPMWIHTAVPTTPTNNNNNNPNAPASSSSSEIPATSVAVNIFFRSLSPTSYAAGRDVYGNRDLAPYERGRKDLKRIVRGFDDLPPDVAGFYLERLGQELVEEARRVGRSSLLHTVYAELS